MRTQRVWKFNPSEKGGVLNNSRLDGALVNFEDVSLQDERYSPSVSRSLNPGCLETVFGEIA